MRSNGLTASAYTPIADVDPRVVGPVLDELKERGVAAYAMPVEPSSLGAIDRPEFRTEVRDRLYVDTGAAEVARELLSAINAEIDTTGDDLAWAQIISGYDQPVAGGVAPWPATEDLSVGDERDGADEGGDRWLADESYDEAPRRRSTREGERAEPEEARAPEDDADRFVPPPPPPLPRLEPRQQVAWLGVVGGPLLLLVSVLFGLHLPGWLSTIAVGSFIAGFIALVVMMGGDDDDSGWDDGAVV